MKKLITSLTALALISAFLAGCAGPGAPADDPAGSGSNGTLIIPDDSPRSEEKLSTALDTDGMFTERDMSAPYTEDGSVLIQLSGDSARCDSRYVDIDGGEIGILAGGTYILRGELNGSVKINAADTDKVQLVLDGASIRAEDSAAIYVKEADKVFVTLARDSKNSLSSGGYSDSEEGVDAVIFSKRDLTLSGEGELDIQASQGHGIVSKDDLAVTSGVYRITAESHGLQGKDSVRIAGGELTVTSGKDGIHSESNDDASLGFLYISGGKFQINAEGDGLSASSELLIDGGELSIISGGGASNGEDHSSNEMPGGMGGAPDRPGGHGGPGGMVPGMGDAPSLIQPRATASDSDVSSKGIKAVTLLTLRQGSVKIDSADDGLHSDGNIAVWGGRAEISSGDDAIHADRHIGISGGEIVISESYEGIESLSLTVSGGDISVTSTDDGINTAGGRDESGFGGVGGFGGDKFGGADSSAFVSILAGKLTINARGDGIDSNGSIYIGGGETLISGPESNGNSTLDYGTESKITGGVLMASGSEGMESGVSDSSTQCTMLLRIGGSTGERITVAGEDGELLSFTPAKAFECVIISSPKLKTGVKYTVSCGSQSSDVTFTETVYSDLGSRGPRR